MLTMSCLSTHPPPRYQPLPLPSGPEKGSLCRQGALGDSDFTAVLRQLLPLMKPRRGEDDTASGSRSREEECGPDELILLLVYLYSLADEAQPSDQDAEEEELEKLERELIGQLTLVITQEQHLSPLLQKLTGERVKTTADS
ncbi:Sec1 family domain-containing protein 2 [Takifugu flavidus]|uniref:Sec1 family domain-containing protein 2 n=1 Tax=Takifugu flavidus TaxID=433684 RepID=A0A5C6MS10_9TELE|nr:Sec1 family domain-containing protein 2 [Takifugu flavidus]